MTQDTAQRRAEAVAIELLERMGLRGHPAASQFVGDILEHDKQTRRATLDEASIAVKKLFDEAQPQSAAYYTACLDIDLALDRLREGI